MAYRPTYTPPSRGGIASRRPYPTRRYARWSTVLALLCVGLLCLSGVAMLVWNIVDMFIDPINSSSGMYALPADQQAIHDALETAAQDIWAAMLISMVGIIVGGIAMAITVPDYRRP